MSTITTSTAPSAKGTITLFTITNASGASVTLSSLGAGIVSVNVPDAEGKLSDVALGYADPADYIADGPCAGKVPGRYANRIARGHLNVDGHVYQLAINNGPNALHGGPEGFQNQIWEAREDGTDSVVFTYLAAAGEESYPGNLTATARYTWTDDCTLRLELSATTDAPTVVNLTNHCYWNLDGHNAGSVLDHSMWLACSRYLPTDDTLIPTGEMAPVTGTPMDFTEPKVIGRDIKSDFPALVYGKGYDNCWVVDGYTAGCVRHVATLRSDRSGRQLDVFTSQPAAQVYTGNWLAGSPANKCGRSYEDYDGVAIECQDMPDSPNHAWFPSTQLYPGQKYDRVIEFRFSAK